MAVASTRQIPRIDRSKPIDPLRLIKLWWPEYRLSREQQMMIRSVWEDRETIVPAGNGLGKDFVSALIALVFFLTRDPCKIVITSVNGPHLGVIWGEIKAHIEQAGVQSGTQLLYNNGGILVVNSLVIKKINPDRTEVSNTYIKNMVCSEDTKASLQGHHATSRSDYISQLKIPHTLAITDESSAIDTEKVTMLKTWARRLIMIGNCWPCENYFRHAVEGFPDGRPGGDIPRRFGGGYERRIIRIRAEDSPNVRYAQAQLQAGMKEDNPKFAPIIIPGLRDYETYRAKRDELDPIAQGAELDAIWYKGSELLLFPPQWIAHSATLAHALSGSHKNRKAKAAGFDCAEGGDDFCMCAGDEFGALEIVSFKTPDTSVIPGHIIAFGKKHNINPQNWIFDRGGGGKEWSDLLRSKGYMCRTIGFGESPSAKPPKIGEKSIKDRVDQFEEKSVYKNRRAEMYGDASIACNPQREKGGYGIPATEEFKELRRQLAAIPKLYNEDGVLYMLPKDKRKKDSKEKTLKEILGCSPDEADAFVMMLFGIQHRVTSGSAYSEVKTSYDGFVAR